MGRLTKLSTSVAVAAAVLAFIVAAMVAGCTGKPPPINPATSAQPSSDRIAQHAQTMAAYRQSHPLKVLGAGGGINR